LLGASSGLRVGELIGLKGRRELRIARGERHSFRCQAEDYSVQTEASCKPIPLDAELAEILLNWRLRSPYPQLNDWVFASPHKKGKQPYWPGSLFRVHLQPALEAAEIPGRRGMAYVYATRSAL